MPPELDIFTPEELALFADNGTPMDSNAPPVIMPPPEPEPAAPAAPVAPEPVVEQAPREPAAAATLAAPEPVDPAAPIDPAAPAAPAPVSMVPHAALHAERAARAELARQNNILTTRMNTILAQQEAANPMRDQLPPLPDLATDPVGYMQALGERQQLIEQTRQQQVYEAQLDGRIEQDEESFKATRPDYEQAAGHYVRSRGAELMNYYPPEQIQKIMTEEIRAIAQESWKRGTSAGEMIYRSAMARGYTPGTQPPAPQPGLTAPPAFTGLPPLPPLPAASAQPSAAQQPSAAAILASVAAGQTANRSLSSATGATPARGFTAEDILKLSDADFEKLFPAGTEAANAKFRSVAGM